jgi:hypothetical protein
MQTGSEIVALLTTAVAYLATIAGDTTSLDTKITVEDLDSGAGTDNKQVVGVVVPGAGGAVVVGGTAGGLDVDVNLQSLTALKVSATAAANTLANPMFTQLSQDGTNAMDATHPIAISATLAANAVGNPLFASVSATGAANLITNPMFFQISQDGTNPIAAANPLPISATMAANATGNRIYTHGNIDQVGGAALGLGEDNAAGSVPVVLASDKYVRVSDDTNANTVANPIAIQISQDGTNALAAANPLPISATMAANAVGNPLYAAVSATAAANTLANPLFIQISQDGTNAMAVAYPLFAIGTSTTAQAAGVATDATPDLVLASQDVTQAECWGIQLVNVGGGTGSALTDADIQVSRDSGTTWTSLTWTACDTLAAAANCDYDFPGNSYTHVRVYTTAAVDTTVTVNLSLRK